MCTQGVVSVAFQVLGLSVVWPAGNPIVCSSLLLGFYFCQIADSTSCLSCKLVYFFYVIIAQTMYLKTPFVVVSHCLPGYLLAATKFLSFYVLQ